MGKLVVAILLAVAVWIGVTLWREGPEHAFGGLFAMLSSPQYGEADAPPGRSQRLAEDALRGKDAEAGREPEGSWWSGDPK